MRELFDGCGNYKGFVSDAGEYFDAVGNYLGMIDECGELIDGECNYRGFVSRSCAAPGATSCASR